MHIKYLSVLLVGLFVKTHANLYTPSVDANLKVGNQRAIGRVHALLPVLQNDNKLFFVDVIGMHDTKKAREGNFGLGYRQLFSTYILGAYGYYDIRQTRFNNTVEQLTFGAEFLTKDLEMRLNGYIPLTSPQVIARRSVTSSVPTIIGTKVFFKKTTQSMLDVPTYGFDVELGHALPFVKDLSVFGAYYHFGAKGSNPINGIRARANWQASDWFSFEAEYAYDKARGSSVFAGINLNHKFGKNIKKLTMLQSKMTQMPIRDVDIVVFDEHTVIDDEVVLNIDNVRFVHDLPSLRAALEEACGELGEHIRIIQRANIRAEDGDLWVPIGDENSPFKGKLFGAWQDADGNFHPSEISNIHIDDHESRYVGLIGFTAKGSLISHVGVRATVESRRIHATVGALVGSANGKIHHSYAIGDVEGIDSSWVGGLVGASYAQIHHSYAIGNVIGFRGSYVGGLVGNAQNEIHHSNAHGYVSGWDAAHVGGLAGHSDGKIHQSYAVTKVSGDRCANVGGLVGSIDGDIYQSYALGDVKGDIGVRIGGLAGESIGEIHQSYACGNVTGGDNSRTGGLVGFSASAINQSYALGNVTGRDNSWVGGLVGQSRGDIHQSYAMGNVVSGDKTNVGGLVGESMCEIHQSYALGNVSSGDDSKAGGLVGFGIGTIKQNYALGDVTGGDMSQVGGLMAGGACFDLLQNYVLGGDESHIDFFNPQDVDPVAFNHFHYDSQDSNDSYDFYDVQQNTVDHVPEIQYISREEGLHTGDNFKNFLRDKLGWSIIEQNTSLAINPSAHLFEDSDTFTPWAFYNGQPHLINLPVYEPIFGHERLGEQINELNEFAYTIRFISYLKAGEEAAPIGLGDMPLEVRSNIINFLPKKETFTSGQIDILAEMFSNPDSRPPSAKNALHDFYWLAPAPDESTPGTSLATTQTLH